MTQQGGKLPQLPDGLTHRERYYAYLLTPEWRAKRKAALERAGNRCQVCNTELGAAPSPATTARPGPRHTIGVVMQEQRTEQPGRVTVTGRIVFEVRRTSGAYREQARPCIEAEPGTLPYWDYRTFKSPEEHDAKLGEKWHDRGTEHQVEHGPRGGVQGIKRRLEDRRAWFVSFADLDELMRFYKKYGQLVITASHGCDDQACVEIYDDYRE